MLDNNRVIFQFEKWKILYICYGAAFVPQRLPYVIQMLHF